MTEQARQAGRGGLQMPPTLVILGAILLVAAIAGQFLPAGSFERAEKVIAGTGIESVNQYTIAAGDTRETIAAEFGVTPPLINIVDPDTGGRVAELTPGDGVIVRVSSSSTREVVVPGSFEVIEGRQYDGILDRVSHVIAAVFSAPIQGFRDKVSIIAFILLIGGAFGIIIDSGAIDRALRTAVEKLSTLGYGWIVIVGTMFLFSLAGAVIGMSEETIPFVLITIPIALRMGYDTITGICMCYVGAHLGFAGAFLNPFTIGVAQGIAEIPPFSGMGYRIIVWLVITSAGAAYVLWYANRVRKDPSKALVPAVDKKLREKFALDAPGHQSMARGADYATVAIILGTVVASALGVKLGDWYLTELSALFVGAGVLVAFVQRLGMQRATDSFLKGTADLSGAALVVAFAAGILAILESDQVLDTILNAIVGLAGEASPTIGAMLMLVFQSVLNFFVPSGSGQAALTMPLMAPLGDLIGVSRQTAVLAFQFGDGFSNMIIPTSAVLMGVLGISGVPWEKWAKFILPLQAVLFGLGLVLLAVAVAIGYQ